MKKIIIGLLISCSLMATDNYDKKKVLRELLKTNISVFDFGMYKMDNTLYRLVTYPNYNNYFEYISHSVKLVKGDLHFKVTFRKSMFNQKKGLDYNKQFCSLVLETVVDKFADNSYIALNYFSEAIPKVDNFDYVERFFKDKKKMLSINIIDLDSGDLKNNDSVICSLNSDTNKIMYSK